MFGIKKRKIEEIKKPIYDVKGQMIIIRCPYCNQVLQEVYSIIINDVKINRCDVCNKEIKEWDFTLN